MTNSSSSSSNVYIMYEQHDCCPVCGSKHFAVGKERKEILNTVPFLGSESYRQAIISFTPALCDICNLSFNVSGLSNQSRALICEHYDFIKPSTGVCARNFTPYVDAVVEHLPNLDAKILDIGGYDGYLLRQLALKGYHNLTLVDPSAQVDDLQGAECFIKTIKGFFPQDDIVYQAREQGKNVDHELYDLVGSKDVIQMVPDPLVFMRGINEVLKLGGKAIIGSTWFNLMHPLQNSHLGINFYYYLAQHSGFKLISYDCKDKVSYVLYTFQKVLDVRSAKSEELEHFANTPQQNPKSFAVHRTEDLNIINSNSSLSAAQIKQVNQLFKEQLLQHDELIIYGTGHHTFNMLACLDFALDDSKLTLLNSDPHYKNRYFLMPNGQHHLVKYAPEVLTCRHVPCLVLGVLSAAFKAEIEELLKSINCTYDQLIYLPEMDA